MFGEGLFKRNSKPVGLNPHTGRPIGCPPSSRDEIAALIKRIDDRRVQHHVDKARAKWESENNALHSAASAFLSEYESYRTGDAVAFTPSPEVLEAFRKAVGG